VGRGWISEDRGGAASQLDEKGSNGDSSAFYSARGKGGKRGALPDPLGSTKENKYLRKGSLRGDQSDKE
jgi:hypothetical protein